MTTKQRQKPATRWTEAACSSQSRVDREAKVIRNVKVLGFESQNKRYYKPEAVEAAKHLYEGAKVYSNHNRDPKAPERRNEDRFGRLVNVSMQKDGLYADLEYLASHPNAEAILESIERFNDTGLSHDAGGEYKIVDGKQVVESITKVYSVDLVQNPATNRNLFESEAPTVSKRKVLSVLREHASVPVAAMLLARMVEMSDVYSPDMEMEEPELEDGQTADPEAQVANAFKAAVTAIVDSDSLTTEEKVAKIKLLLETKDAMSESTQKTQNDATVKALQDELEVLRKEKAERLAEEAQRKTEADCKQLLESLKREATPVRISTLAACKEADRKQVAESWPEIVERPAASPSKFKESAEPEAGYKPAENTEALRRRLGL